MRCLWTAAHPLVASMTSGTTTKNRAAMAMKRNGFFVLLLQCVLGTGCMAVVVVVCFKSVFGVVAGCDGGVYGGGVPLV